MKKNYILNNNKNVLGYISANLVNVWLPRGSLTSPLCFYIQCAACHTLSLCAGPLPLISTLPLYSSRGPSHAWFLSLNIISLETSFPATLPFAPFCQFHCNAFASLYCQGKKHPNKPVENKYLQVYLSQTDDICQKQDFKCFFRH